MYYYKNSSIVDSTAAVLLTSNAVIKKFAALRQRVLRRVAIALTTSITSSGDVVVRIKKYPVIGSASNEVLVETLTIPAASVAGAVIYKDLAIPYKFVAGSELVFEVTTAATSAGGGICLFESEDAPEDPRNNAAMVKSA